MPDTDPKDPAIPVAPDPATNPLAAFDGFRFDMLEEVLLEMLPDADDRVRWKDCKDQDYESGTRLAMNRQILLGAVIKRNLTDLEPLLRGIVNPDAGNLATRLMLLADPKYGAMLSDLYTAAHPTTVPVGTDAGDLFPAEEMAKAILPFSVRPLLEVARVAWPAIAKLLGAAGVPVAPSI